MSSINLTHHFLIAMPNMADPYFSRTLTYICEHNDQGALGLVVNRPIDMTLQADRKSTRLNSSHGYISYAVFCLKKKKKKKHKILTYTTKSHKQKHSIPNEQLHGI